MFVYGEPRTQDRHLIWELLRHLNGVYQGPWLMMGDFDEVLWEFEHFSTQRHPEKQMIDFHEILT
jgi:hypothetical protein